MATNFPKDPNYHEAAVLKIFATAQRPLVSKEIADILDTIKHSLPRTTLLNTIHDLNEKGLIRIIGKTHFNERRRPPNLYEITEEGSSTIQEVQEHIRAMLELNLR